jgi:hypothetical protein
MLLPSFGLLSHVMWQLEDSAAAIFRVEMCGEQKVDIDISSI